ncbi:MAG: formiminoglutamate deiminase [Arenicella sp.]|jgi:formiminoglutamate deiminase
MKTYYFEALLTENGWDENVKIQIDQKGIILSIQKDSSPEGTTLDIGLPGFQNAHSHSFQYAMAGLAEKHSTGQTPDDFWSWREAMYSLALSISPDQLEKIAKMLYVEMLRHGYTNVAEFHYVHHDKDGKPFDNLSEMGERLVKAAKEVGIGITLVPIFYQMGGFGKAPTDGQKRFISPDLESYLRLFEASKKSCELYEHANIAVGIHSMRGVEPTVIAELAANHLQDVPFHIHVSEQLKEIEDSIAYLGKRPVEWMLDNIKMNDRFHLVHATHLTPEETLNLAKSGANVVLCPSTEGNLGDGLFPLKDYQDAGGRWSIGTDSHVGLNPLEELRILDYGQRLITHKRNTFYSKNQGNSGLFAFEQITRSGRKAMNNFNATYFKVGETLDVAVVSKEHPLLQNCSFENLANTILFSSDSSMQWGTISKGELVVENGAHFLETEVQSGFSEAILQLKNR